jgi:SPP1 gp7 family putative phage head morphogenesis protein
MPNQYARQYFREIKRRIDADTGRVQQAFREEIIPRILRYRRARSAPATNSRRLRINDELDEIRLILERLRELTEIQEFVTSVIELVAREFVDQVNAYSRANFRQQIVRVMGVDPTLSEPWLGSLLETFVQENVKLVKSISKEYHDKLDTIVLQGVRRGDSTTEIGQRIAELGDVSVRRGRFIARDQIGTVHGELTKRRQENAGLTRFRWSTSHDSRVRDSHRHLDGKVYTWAEGARNDRGDRIWPGTDYQCRCTAEVVIEDLLGEEDDDG